MSHDLTDAGRDYRQLRGGLIYGGLIHGRSFVLAINKSDIKQVSQKQENKNVLSSDYWAYIN
jgi:hypothetical protein